jgi:hypothetical protein
MSRPVRRARSTDCTINSWQAAKKFAIGIPQPNIDRAVAETDFFQLGVTLLPVRRGAEFSRQEFGLL